MAGISDLPFRLIAREFGCPLAFTEMVNARALGLTNRKTLRLLESSPIDRPLGIQLLAREPEHLLEALDILESHSYDVIDLNAACPVRKVTRKGEGAALLKEPEALSRLVQTLVDRSPVPVTVKIRAGWDHQSINAIEMAKRIADAGAHAVCVHGRTKSQGYGGKADMTVIEAVKNAVSIPVIGSGDIFSGQAAIRAMEETGCDAVMVARGGLGNPWIFQETTAMYRGETVPSRPGLDTLRSVMNEHLALSVEYYGTRLGVMNFRKFFAWYTKGLRNARLVRPKAFLANTTDEMRKFIGELQMPLSPDLPLPVSPELPCDRRPESTPASNLG
jgi:tRNA-dihydrouridine synthase B